MDIEAVQIPLRKLFSDEFLFRIPNYQRPYSWGVEQVSQLFNDLYDALTDRKTSGEEHSQYFLGTLILVKSDNSPESQVLDGQQRIITLTVLLAVLRHAITDRDFADAISDYIRERGNVIAGTPDRFRLALRERDEEFFRDLIQIPEGLENLSDQERQNLSDVPRRIVENAKLLSELVCRLTEEDQQQFTQFLVNSCVVVVVSTPDFESAFRVFSRLNSRGIDLSHADVLKAELIGLIEPREQDRYTRKWEDVEEQLGQESFLSLFGHMVMARYHDVLRESMLTSFKRVFHPETSPASFIDHTLIPYSDCFTEILSSDYSIRQQSALINRYLTWLNRLNHSDWIPPVLEIFRLRHNDSAYLQEFLNKLERLSAALMIARVQGRERILRYARILREFSAGADLFRQDSPIQLTDSEKEQVLVVLGGDIYLESLPVRRYVLQRLNSEIADVEQVYVPRQTSIEHVLPQNPRPNSYWIQYFPDENERIALTNKLGNLVLLSRKKNSEASNFDFAEKKERYFRVSTSGVATYALTVRVINEGDWTPETIRRYQHEHISILRRIWDL